MERNPETPDLQTQLEDFFHQIRLLEKEWGAEEDLDQRIGLVQLDRDQAAGPQAPEEGLEA